MKNTLLLTLSLTLLSVNPLALARETARNVEVSSTLSEKEINKALNDAYAKFKGVKEGKNADYIPALAKVNSELFGIALVTLDGKVYTKGDVDKEFAIESISKVFTMANVMQESGEDKILKSIGVDATGMPFNSIVAIEKKEGKMQNPFVNPGAITTTSFVKGNTADEIWNRIISTYSAFAGRPLEVNQEVYKSEADTNQRNQAIGKLMNAYGMIEKNPDQATDIYTKQCSVNVSAKDLAIMASSLANGGVNPVTKQKVVDQKHVKGILATMATAGLYDTTGEWLYKSGLPAKSGVGGGIIAIAPGKFGIAAFSPRLDEAGNSIRAQRAIIYVTEQLNANPYDVKPIERTMQAEEEKPVKAE